MRVLDPQGVIVVVECERAEEAALVEEGGELRVALVARNLVKIIKDLVHAAKFLVLDRVPQRDRAARNDVLHAHRKVARHALENLQRRGAAEEEVLVAQARHDLVHAVVRRPPNGKRGEEFGEHRVHNRKNETCVVRTALGTARAPRGRRIEKPNIR